MCLLRVGILSEEKARDSRRERGVRDLFQIVQKSAGVTGGERERIRGAVTKR